MGSLEHILNKAFLGMGGGRSNFRWICEESVFLKIKRYAICRCPPISLGVFVVNH
jgi:hypothetical protein